MMTSKSSVDPFSKIYSSVLTSATLDMKKNPMAAVQRLYETLEHKKVKNEVITEARFKHEHPFRPNLNDKTKFSETARSPLRQSYLQ